MKKSKEVILIKLGGSVITDKDKPYTVRIDTIKKLARELKRVKNVSLVLSHGSGSFAHVSAKQYGGKKGYISKMGIAKVAKDAMEINKIVMDIFIREELPVVSLRPMSMILTREGEIKKELFKIIEELLKQDLIPVVYGDVIWDQKWKSTIYSGEATLNAIGLYLIKNGFNVNRVIQAGQTNGVYNFKKNTIPLINKRNWHKIKQYLYENDRADVTGSMGHKIENALEIAKKGINTLLINGNDYEELSHAINRNKIKGTMITI